MAVGALRALAALVNVIRQMATYALLRGAFVPLACVAGSAGDFAMLVGEREGGLLVIEVILLPHLRVVAKRAIGPERAAVNIVLAMAVDAGRERLAIRSVRTMAAAAGHRHVRIFEGEIGQVVREAGLVELVDVGVTTQMLGVAAPALTGGGLLHAAVIAGPGADVSGDVLVTFQALWSLALAVGAVVAVAAFTFELGVGLRNGPRHDEFLDAGGVRGRGEQRGEQHKQQRLRQGPWAEHAVSPRSVHVH